MVLGKKVAATQKREILSQIYCATRPSHAAESASKKPYLVDILILRDMTYHDGGGGMPREEGGGGVGQSWVSVGRNMWMTPNQKHF